jgi:hypothetical protein
LEIFMKAKLLKPFTAVALFAMSFPALAAGACCVAGAVCCLMGMPCCE